MHNSCSAAATDNRLFWALSACQLFH